MASLELFSKVLESHYQRYMQLSYALMEREMIHGLPFGGPKVDPWDDPKWVEIKGQMLTEFPSVVRWADKIDWDMLVAPEHTTAIRWWKVWQHRKAMHARIDAGEFDDSDIMSADEVDDW